MILSSSEQEASPHLPQKTFWRRFRTMTTNSNPLKPQTLCHSKQTQRVLRGGGHSRCRGCANSTLTCAAIAHPHKGQYDQNARASERSRYHGSKPLPASRKPCQHPQSAGRRTRRKEINTLHQHPIYLYPQQQLMLQRQDGICPGPQDSPHKVLTLSIHMSRILTGTTDPPFGMGSLVGLRGGRESGRSFSRTTTFHCSSDSSISPLPLQH